MIQRLIGLIREEIMDIVEKDKEARLKKEEYLLNIIGDKTFDCVELGSLTYKNPNRIAWNRYGSVTLYVTVIPNDDNYIFFLDAVVKSLDKADKWIDLGIHVELTDIVESLLPLAGEKLLDFLDNYVCLKPKLFSHNSLEPLRKYIFEHTNLKPDYSIHFNSSLIRDTYNYRAEVLRLEEKDTVIQLYELEDLSILD